MRIIAGTYGGRKLISPDGKVRPMRDRVRESLFNIIPWEGNFLDMFAGTGAVGIEAISRGFSHTRFVELNGKTLSTLKKNIEILGIPNGSYEIVRGNVFYLFKDIEESPMYDIIFCGTPFIEDMYPKVFALGLEKLLRESGILIIQTESTFIPPESWETRCYGKDALHFYRR